MRSPLASVMITPHLNALENCSLSCDKQVSQRSRILLTEGLALRRAGVQEG